MIDFAIACLSGVILWGGLSAAIFLIGVVIFSDQNPINIVWIGAIPGVIIGFMIPSVL